MISTYIDGISHWFNEVFIDGVRYQFDLTADQFDLDKVIVGTSPIHGEYRVRSLEDVNQETFFRTALLADKMGLSETVSKIKANLIDPNKERRL